MSGDANNTNIWADADVYISTNLSAAIPANAGTAFGVDWTLVGLLDGGDGFEDDRNEDVKDHFAWGGKLVKQSRKNFKLTKKFTVLEDSTTTRSLIWPGSTATAIFKPVPVPIMIAFETRSGGKVTRLISKSYAKVEVDGKVKEGEDDLTKVTLTATIFPDAYDQYYIRQTTPNVVSIALSPLTLALTTGISKLVVATATYSDSTTANVSDRALWTSSAPSKATVVGSTAGGVVTWASAGSTNISCTFDGITATAPSVVTAT